MFCYLDFRCYFEANGQNHIQFRLMRVLKFGKTSNRAVENLPQRKLLSLSSKRCTLSPTELPRVFI